MYQTTLNQQPAIIEFGADGQPLLNGEPFGWDIATLSDRTFHIIRNDQSFTAEVTNLNAAEKSVTLKINGHLHTVALKDRFDLLLEQMGMGNATAAKVGDLKAPMPGLIVGLNVAPGDSVRKGDIVLILEAMKMENAIKAPADAVVKSAKITKGDRVEKGQVLVEFA